MHYLRPESRKFFRYDQRIPMWTVLALNPSSSGYPGKASEGRSPLPETLGYPCSPRPNLIGPSLCPQAYDTRQILSITMSIQIPDEHNIPWSKALRLLMVPQCLWRVLDGGAGFPARQRARRAGPTSQWERARVSNQSMTFPCEKA